MEFLRLMRVGGVCISLHAEPKRLITIGSNKERVKNVLARLHGTQLGLYSVFSLFFFKTLSQTTNFRLVETERVCRRHFSKWQKWQKVLNMGIKHCWKRLLLVTSNFFFSHCVFKRLVQHTRKNQVLLFGKGFNPFPNNKFCTLLN